MRMRYTYRMCKTIVLCAMCTVFSYFSLLILHIFQFINNRLGSCECCLDLSSLFYRIQLLFLLLCMRPTPQTRGIDAVKKAKNPYRLIYAKYSSIGYVPWMILVRKFKCLNESKQKTLYQFTVLKIYECVCVYAWACLYIECLKQWYTHTHTIAH